MKRLILSFVLGTFLATGAFSQGLSFGVKGGLNISNVKASGGGLSLDTKALVGFHLGGYLTAMLTENLGIQPELLYSTQGDVYDVLGSSFTTHLNYITIPVLLRYNINDMISFHAGPQLGLLTSANVVSGNTTTDVKDQTNGTDFSLAFGGTIDLPMKINLTARYCLGLSDIDKNSNSTTKTTNFQFSVGYKIFGANK